MESISDISFDFEENPYLQYSAKDLAKLFKKLFELTGVKTEYEMYLN